MDNRKLSVITGVSYLVIFFTAIFANFFVLESLKQNPIATSKTLVGLGIIAF